MDLQETLTGHRGSGGATWSSWKSNGWDAEAARLTTVQHDIVWVWPNVDPQYKDIITKKKPPYFLALDDPSYTKLMGNRDIPYRYNVLIDNLMDPAHVPYAHYRLMRTQTPTVNVDREGGRPLETRVKKLNVNGYTVLNNQVKKQKEHKNFNEV
ncbi:hypothetical protein F3Y22_tig00110828pilonHSYRG00005 [Hibiscus syriacus]|uniref:Uncharacterized protein n=1 Tax=Hibiscus syriacus TaxID=106335 RepID=A0A6A2ZMM9_HIBSY|nr:hypothetical protein F3Y22_tig00110828pilonHSYRG00005 [Hibiscus syriacus]